MPAELLMPRVSPAMQDATVVEWKKKEGDPISKDEIVVTIECEKASQDVEALAEGTLYKILAQPGDIVPVNKPLAIIRTATDRPEDLRSYDSLPADSGPSSGNGSPAESGPQSKKDGKVRSSPLARKLAESRGIDLAAIPAGSGPGGRIVEQDVLAYCESLAQAPGVQKTGPDDKHIPLTTTRQHAIRMLRQSKDHVVPVTSVTEIDLTALLELYRQIKPAWQEANHVKVTLNAFFVKAVALALREHKLLNATLAENEIIVWGSVNIGLAMHINEGLYVPVIKDADSLSVLKIAEGIADFADKIGRKAITAEDMSGATFTITNVGPFDVLFSTPVIVYPQVGILGIGKITERPVFQGEAIVKRSLAYFALTYDHRAVDGVPAASFRKSLQQLLERPAVLLI